MILYCPSRGQWEGPFLEALDEYEMEPPSGKFRFIEVEDDVCIQRGDGRACGAVPITHQVPARD